MMEIIFQFLAKHAKGCLESTITFALQLYGSYVRILNTVEEVSIYASNQRKQSTVDCCALETISTYDVQLQNEF